MTQPKNRSKFSKFCYVSIILTFVAFVIAIITGSLLGWAKITLLFWLIISVISIFKSKTKKSRILTIAVSITLIMCFGLFKEDANRKQESISEINDTNINDHNKKTERDNKAKELLDNISISNTSIKKESNIYTYYFSVNHSDSVFNLVAVNDHDNDIDQKDVDTKNKEISFTLNHAPLSHGGEVAYFLISISIDGNSYRSSKRIILSGDYRDIDNENNLAARGNTNPAPDNVKPKSKTTSKSTEKAANQSGPSNLEYSNGAVHSSPQQTIQKFENCTELNRVYPHGVGLSGAVDKVKPGAIPVTSYTINDALYRSLNGNFDRDKDGIACEK